MSNSTEVYCLNAYDNGGNFLCTLRCGQPSEIGQDYSYLIPNIGNREVEYICYTDKCGCACCLSNENEIIIHSTQGEIKTLTGTPSRKCIYVKWNEIFGGNWCRTMIRYKNNGYPTSITDGTLGGTETTQNQYSSNGLCVQVPNFSTTYYFRAFALDGNDNIIIDKCAALQSGPDFQTTYFGYTGTVQSITLPIGIFCLEVWGASGGNSTYHGYCGGKGGYSAGKYTVSGSSKTLYIYVGGAGQTVNSSGVVYGGWNGGGGTGGQYYFGASHIGTGGGATDIATLNCTMTTDSYYRYVRDTTSYNSRIIVAGGGGGAENTTGGSGGGICGGRSGYGGSQTGAGSVYTDSMSSYGCYSAGAFGYGMSVWNTHCNHAMSAPGGGGYYGGGGFMCNGNQYSNNVFGGGGSGYVGGVSGGITCCGDTTFPAPNGGTETGHSGNGCVKISLI